VTNKGAALETGGELDRRIRQQLDRILASGTFQQVDRLRRFLSFIVLEALEGRRDLLKEYVVGVQVFGKEESFDPRTDPVVRVQARRLRTRLQRYYRDEGAGDELLIDLPKGGYAPLFTPREAPTVRKRSLGAALVTHNSVAVLPFADHSQQHDKDWFCQGIRDEIIRGLAGMHGLRILALDPEAAPGATTPMLKDVDASVIIGGSIRTAGDRLRVTAHLIDAASGCYVWSDAVDACTDDTFEAQERITAAIVDKLRPELADSPHPKAPHGTTMNLAAHNLFLQGRYHLNQRTEEGLRKAADFFERALVEDAQYALAHSGLSDAYGLLAHYGVLKPSEVWARAASSAATAVMLDGNSAEAHTSLAHVKSTQDWDWDGAEREFQRAVTLDRRYATAHHWYAASCLAPVGRLDEALDHIQIAQSLDPVSSIIARDVAVIRYYRREFDIALEQCDHTIELNPHFSPAYWTLGLIQAQLKDFDESEAAFQRAAHLAPRSPRMPAALARIYALSGRKPQALKLLKQLEATARERYVAPIEFAAIHFALEQIDLGFQWLGKACDDRCFELLSINVDPRFDDIRQDERFQHIARQMGLA